jgi:hypothetical protein
MNIGKALTIHQWSTLSRDTVPLRLLPILKTVKFDGTKKKSFVLFIYYLEINLKKANSTLI